MTDSHNRRLRKLLAARNAVIVPGAANALAARTIEDVGFEAIYVTGAGVTNTYLGVPDLGLISVTELADHVAAMREAVDLPLIVDADTGFGNPINVIRTVKLLERAGASAIQLEDQSFPKRCGHFSGKTVVETEEMVQKLRAAVDARKDDDLVIIARTDAIAVHGFSAAIERAEAFIEAGADMTFVEAPRTIEQLREIPERLKVPQLLNLVAGGVTPMVELSELRDMRFSVVLYANAALQAAIEGMQTVLGHLYKNGSLTGIENRVASFELRQKVVSKPLYDALEKKYAHSGK